jgi:hypothetical protein
LLESTTFPFFPPATGLLLRVSLHPILSLTSGDHYSIIDKMAVAAGSSTPSPQFRKKVLRVLVISLLLDLVSHCNKKCSVTWNCTLILVACQFQLVGRSIMILAAETRRSKDSTRKPHPLFPLPQRSR